MLTYGWLKENCISYQVEEAYILFTNGEEFEIILSKTDDPMEVALATCKTLGFDFNEVIRVQRTGKFSTMWKLC
jgi:hypothetical protein